jgi:phosphoribosylformylglycinamidine (FGAM) synthase-like amidotransferase family enzyme
MLVNKVDKRVKLDKREVVKYQILTYCFLNGVQISESDLNCLTELGLLGEDELTSFCTRVSEMNIFKSPQSARNAISKAEKKNLLVKNGKNRKTIKLNDLLNVQVKGTVMLDFKFVAIEAEKVQRDTEGSSEEA